MIKAALISVILSVQGAQPLADPAEEARAQDLMREIRCVACENEPVSQSGAEIASDMRVRIRLMVSQGHSDEEIRAWFVERYGEFVLFRPDADGVTGRLLWGLPFVLLLLGGAMIALRRPSTDKQTVDAVKPEDI